MKTLDDLTMAELMAADGGSVGAFGCFLLGGFAAAAFFSGNLWAMAGGLIAAYNGGCFD